MRYSSMDHLRPNGWVTRADAIDASFAWNQRTAHFVSSATTDSWSHICSGPYGGLAGHIAKRSFITGDKESCIGNLGRPQHPQESKLEIYCRYQRVGHLEKITHKYEQWEQHLCSIPNYRTVAAHAHGAFVSSLALATFKNWMVTFGIRISWTNHFHGVWVRTTLQKKELTHCLSLAQCLVRFGLQWSTPKFFAVFWSSRWMIFYVLHNTCC